MTAPIDIDLRRAEVSALIGASVRDDAAPFGLYAWAATEPAAEAARWVEREVFGEVFGDTPELLAEEYGPYEASSVFLCVVDHLRRLPAGVIRVGLPAPAGQKTLRDLGRVWGADPTDRLAAAGLDLSRDLVVDVATLAVLPDYRGGGSEGLVSFGLYQALATASLLAGVTAAVAVLDVAVFDLLQAHFAEPFQVIPGLAPRPYLGSPRSVAAWTDACGWAARLAAHDRGLYRQLCEGAGLEPVVSHPAWESVAELLATHGLDGQLRARDPQRELRASQR